MTYTYPTLDNEPALTESDAMALGFFSRAAEAIRAVPSLIEGMNKMSADLTWVRDERDTLRERCEMQSGDIDTLRQQLDTTLTAEQRARDDFFAMRDERNARQNDIDILDDTVADLHSEIDDLRQQLDHWKAKSELQSAALDTVVGQINAINQVLGKPNLDPDPREEIEAACAASPSAESKPEPNPTWEHGEGNTGWEIADGRDDPSYRREVAEDGTHIEHDFREPTGDFGYAMS